MDAIVYTISGKIVISDFGQLLYTTSQKLKDFVKIKKDYLFKLN